MAETVDLATLTVSRQELATLLGLSSARIGQMVGEGIIPAPVGHGRYLLAEWHRHINGKGVQSGVRAVHVKCSRSALSPSSLSA